MTKCLDKIQDIYLKRVENNSLPSPRIIHVETRSKCNAFCNFCPASVATDKRKDIYMPEEFIEKIIDELHVLDYAHRLSFYNNNEPFLDERIYQFVKSARERLPKAYLELKSNGTVLTTEKILKIFNAGLDMLYINYFQGQNQPKTNIQEIKKDLENMRRFKGHLESDLYFTRIKIYFRSINEVMGTRAGNSPNKKYKGGPLQKMCLRPCEMMTISPKGDVSVCSEDFYYTIKMGNINEQSLPGIWRSEDWNKLRRTLVLGERSLREACAQCDYKGYNLEILKENGLRANFPFLSRVKNYIKRVVKRN